MNTNQRVIAQSIKSLITAAILLFFGTASTVLTAQEGTIAPPSFGEETKGTPALPEEAPLPEEQAAPKAEADEEDVSQSVLGSAEITESRRENGQVYRIELKHSMGSRQYIEEHDSDGKIESTSNDIEETPNLPKWRLGSW